MNIPTWSATAAYAIDDVVVRVVNGVARLYRAQAAINPPVSATWNVGSSSQSGNAEYIHNPGNTQFQVRFNQTPASGSALSSSDPARVYNITITGNSNVNSGASTSTTTLSTTISDLGSGVLSISVSSDAFANASFNSGGGTWTISYGTPTVAPESDSNNWEELSPQGTAPVNPSLKDWSDTAAYAQNDIVSFNDKIYRAINAIPTAGDTDIATWNLDNALAAGVANYSQFGSLSFNKTALTGNAPSANSATVHNLELTGNSIITGTRTATGAIINFTDFGNTASFAIGSNSIMQTAFGTSSVFSGGGTWRLYTSSVNMNPETDTTNWEVLSPPSLKDWSGTAAYAQNDIVSFNDKIYRAINAIAAGEAETNIATWNVNTAANTQAAQYTAASGIFVFNGTALSGTAPSANSATVHNLELTGNSVRTGTNTATGAIVDYSTGFFATRNIRITDTATMQAAFGNANIQSGGGTWRLYTGGGNANPETDTTNWEEQSAGAGGGSDYAGVYADNQSYAVGKYVLHNGNMYGVTTAIPANNTVDPDANTSFALMTLAESAVDAVRPVLSFWDGETNPATDVNTGTTATVAAGSSVTTPYDAANDRLILSQGNGAANQVRASWSNPLIDWNNFAMGFKIERPTKSDGVVLMAFFGCDPNDLPTLPQGANRDEGFSLEISRGNDSAHGLGQGGWTFGLVPYVGGSSNPPNNGRILPAAYYNGAVSGVSGDGNERNYVSLPTSFYTVSEVSMVLVRAGKLIKLYGKDASSQAPAIKFAEWRLTQAQQDRATSSAYGFSGGNNNAAGQQSYLKEVAVGNPGMTVVEEAFRVGEPQTSGGGGTTYTGGNGIDVTGTVISVDLDGASLTSGSNGLRVTNPFTDDDETKLDGIAAGATVGATTAQALAIANNTNKRSYPQADQTKLAGIAAGATVGATAAQEARIAANDNKRTYPQADQTKLAGVEANATADMTAAEIRDALMTLQGANRLSANFIKDLPNNYKGAYANNTAYAEGNVVEYQAEIYVAAQAIPASNTTAPSTTNTAWIHLSAEGGSGGGAFNTAADIVNALMGLSGDNRLDVSAVKGVITPSAGTGINVSNTGAISLNTVGAARELSDLTQGDRISASAIAGLQFQDVASIVTALNGLTQNKLSYDALDSATQPAANAVVVDATEISNLDLFLPNDNVKRFGKMARSAQNAPPNVTELSYISVARLNNSDAVQVLIDSETNKVFVRKYANNAWEANWTEVSNRFLTADENKLDGIEAGATVGATSEQQSAIADNTQKRTYPQSDESKLAGIEAGATADQTGDEIITAINGASGQINAARVETGGGGISFVAAQDNNDGRPNGAVVFNTNNETFYEKVSGAYVARYTITSGGGGAGTWRGNYANERAYAFGEIVVNDNNLWIARTAIPVDNTTPPAVGNSWWRITNLSQTAVSSDEYGSANNATMFVTIISQIDAAVVKLVASPNQTINIDGNSYTRHDIDKLMRMRKSYQKLLSNAIARSGNTRARKAKVKG